MRKRIRIDSRANQNKNKIIFLYKKGKSTNEIGELLGIDGSNVYRFLKRIGFILRSHSDSVRLAIVTGRMEILIGSKNSSWKGGKTRHSKGYVLIRNPTHHRSTKNGYVMEHVLVLEKKLGRSLKPNEIVHHINHKKTDNHPANLQVMTRSQHQRFHWKENRIEWLKNLSKARNKNRRNYGF